MTLDLTLDPLVYRALHTGTLGDLAFYRDVVLRGLGESQREARLSVLELGCGAGRLALPLWALGADVVGVDLHEGLLELARAERARQLKASERDSEGYSEAHPADVNIDDRGDLTLSLRDFTALSLEDLPGAPSRGFDLILLPYNGLYCLPDEESQRRCLQGLVPLLAPGGSVWVDGYALPDPDEYAYESEEDFSPLTVIELPYGHVADQDKSEARALGVEERDIFDLERQRLEIHYRYLAEPERAAVEPLHQRCEVIEHRYLYPWQLPTLGASAGLKLEALYADFGAELDRDLGVELEVDLSESALRALPWGVELEHWVARYSRDS